MRYFYRRHIGENVSPKGPKICYVDADENVYVVHCGRGILVVNWYVRFQSEKERIMNGSHLSQVLTFSSKPQIW